MQSMTAPPATAHLRSAPHSAAGAVVPASRTPIPLGARRMPPVNRTQRVEWVDVPIAYAPPLRENSAEWPIIDVYRRNALPQRDDE